MPEVFAEGFPKANSIFCLSPQNRLTRYDTLAEPGLSCTSQINVDWHYSTQTALSSLDKGKIQNGWCA